MLFRSDSNCVKYTLLLNKTGYFSKTRLLRVGDVMLFKNFTFDLKIHAHGYKLTENSHSSFWFLNQITLYHNIWKDQAYLVRKAESEIKTEDMASNMMKYDTVQTNCAMDGRNKVTPRPRISQRNHN